MNDRALMNARLVEVERRMNTDGVAEAERGKRIGSYIGAVLEDERTGAWQPFAAEGAPVATAPSPAPVAPAPTPAAADPAVRSRSIWAKATTEANSELALSEPAPPADPQADAKTGATQMPPAGSVARSRSAWGRAVADANAELVRRGGKVSEG